MQLFASLTWIKKNCNECVSYLEREREGNMNKRFNEKCSLWLVLVLNKTEILSKKWECIYCCFFYPYFVLFLYVNLYMLQSVAKIICNHKQY